MFNAHEVLGHEEQLGQIDSSVNDLVLMVDSQSTIAEELLESADVCLQKLSSMLAISSDQIEELLEDEVILLKRVLDHMEEDAHSFTDLFLSVDEVSHALQDVVIEINFVRNSKELKCWL